MAIILSLETATTNCSAAIAIDGKVVAIREENKKKFSHSEKLHVFIEELLEEAKLKQTDLEAIAVSKGPGSYTGLRIGVSSAKGLSFALDIPLISVSTLELLAHQVDCPDCYIVPMLDARRMEVYSAIFDSEKNQIRDTQAQILEEDSFLDYLSKKKTVFLGDGAAKFEAICTHENASFLVDRYPSSREMAVLAEHKYKIGDIEDVAYFEPFYLKEFLAG